MNPLPVQSAVNIRSRLQVRHWSRKAKRFAVVLSFLAPSLLLYGLFMLYPMIDAVRLSLFDWDGASPTMSFIGLDNYMNLLKDDVFMQSLFHNLVWVVISLTLVVIPTLVLAVLISKVKKGRLFFRAGFYLPSVISLAVVGVLWAKIYDPLMGPINVTLQKAGLGSLAHNWLGEQWTVLPALVIVGTWAFYGSFLILYLAGLQNIDPSLYEAAEIDGAGPVRKFLSITIPSLRYTMNVVISMVIIYAFKGFALIWIMTQGGPFYKSEVVSTYIYKSAFGMNKVSYATAGGVLLAVIVITLTILFNQWRERRE